MAGMEIRNTTLTTPDGPMRVYEAIPDDPKGALIVIAEAFGVNDHIEDVTRRAADAGYHAVAPDLFFRSGVGTVAYDPLDFERLQALFAGMSGDTVASDLAATLAHLADAGFAPTSTGVTGFCWGGWATCFAAATFRLGAAVTWYGGGIVEQGFLPFPPIDVSQIATPWLGQFGDLDQGIPAEQLDRLQQALDAAGLDVATEIVRYPGADHGFHCDDRPKVYNADAAAAGWERAMAWFDAHLS
jgi:carboxymethylenebutenolidase